MNKKIMVGLIVCLLLALNTTAFALSLLKAVGSSMAPTVKAGERVWIIPYHSNNPKRGDVVAFRLNGVVRLKRIIGMPGDIVTIRHGSVYITNKWNPKGYKLAEPYLVKGTFTPRGRAYVPNEYYFVLGDNRQHSQDSLDFGPIPRRLIIGKARDLLMLPLNKK